MKIYVVSYRFGHHYTASGYNRLSDFVPCRRIAVPSAVNNLVRSRVDDSAREALKSTTGLLGYFPECRLLESWVRACTSLPGKSLFHFIYPENSYYFTASRQLPPRVRLVATYHQPIAESRQFILKTDAIRRLDRVILLSESQREFFEPLVGTSRISVVPHGIDVEFFRPGTRTPSDGKRILAVGSWLRDFSTLVDALRMLERSDPTIGCDVVTGERNRSLFAGLSNVTVHAGISDAELLGLYHRSSLAALSLSGAAANNALLEAMACGLPIVATDLPAVREYTPAAGAHYVPPSNPSCFAEAIRSVFAEGWDAMTRMGAANRERASHYSWEETAKRTMAVYDAVA